MRNYVRDTLSSLVAVVGAVVVFARLESYKWWLIGSWKGALGVIAVLGLALLLINVMELFRFAILPNFVETFLWIAAATVVIASLFSTTTKLEFIWSAALVGVAGLAHMVDHFWQAGDTHKPHFLATH